MIRRTVAIAVPLLVLLALFAGGAPVVGAQESGDNPAVGPPTELQDEYPLHDSAAGRSDPASPAARPDDLTRSTASEGGDGRSPALWLMIALAAGLGIALLVRVVPLVVRRLQRLRPTRARRTAPAAKREIPQGRGPRPRFGPVLRPRKRVQFTPHEFAFVNRAQSKEMGLEEGDHGLLLATDEQGKRWTLVGNPELVRAMVKSPPYGEVAGVDITSAKFPVKRQGWPEEWGGIAPDGHH